MKKITHQLHSDSVIGKLDRGLVYFFLNWFYRKVPAYKTLEDLEYKRLIFQEQMAFISEKFAERKFPVRVKESFNKSVKSFQGLMNIIDLEIWAQKNYDKSVLNVSDSPQAEVLRRQFSLLDLQKYFLDNQNSFPEKTPQYGVRGEFFMEVNKDLSFLTYEQFEKVTRIHQKQYPEGASFEYELVLLQKAVTEFNKANIDAKVLKEQFLKTCKGVPSYAVAVLKSLLAKISDKKIKEELAQDSVIKEILF